MTPELNNLHSQLEQAKADHALLLRLQGAEARLGKLTKRYEAAAKDHEARESKRAEAKRAARFVGLSDLTVSDISKQGAGEGILQRQFRISWTAPAYDYATQQNRTKVHSVVGFNAAPETILRFLIEQHPEQIPAGIKALCPHDLPNAFREYFTSLKRGYTRGAISS